MTEGYPGACAVCAPRSARSARAALGSVLMQSPANVPEVVIEDLHKAFKGKVVLSGIDLTIARGEMIAIVGGSGCGKTVLLKHITAHFTPDRGRVLVADHDVDPGADGAAPMRDIGTLSALELDQVRMHWAVVFQRNALITGTVMDNLALLLREVQGMDDERIRPLAVKALTDVGLDPDLVLSRDREELSGGMAKRVAIARALVIDPVLILYDEPTAGLDPEMCVQIHELIRHTHNTQPALAATRGGAVRTTIIVTHDTELLQRLQPRIVMLHDGGVLFDGPFEDFTRSDNPHITPYLAQMHQLHNRTLPPASHDHELAETRRD
jgi:phospholipid/cholesterol/gamma-HCH transport system ATP-binding protein